MEKKQREIKNRPKKGSRQEAKEEALWYVYLRWVLSDVVVSDAAETSHMSNNYRENEYEIFLMNENKLTVRFQLKKKFQTRVL